MSDFITLSCPSCGGQLQVTRDLERFACGHCGTEHIVKRGGGTVSLQPVMEKLDTLQATSERATSELAIPRLERELADLYEKRKARAEEAVPMSEHLVVVLLLGGGGVFAFAALTNFRNTFINVLCVAALAGLVINWILLTRRKRGSDAILEEIDGKIAGKRAELARHRSRVDGS